MFGKIVSITDKYVKLINLSKRIQSNVINYHTIFERDNFKIVGEIESMDNEFINILLVGEIRNNIFVPGIIHYPSADSICRIIYKQELELILGSQNYMSKDNLLIGSSSLYDGFKVTCKINDFWSQHFAIIGNSGCGKSCGVASMIQNIFYYNEKLPINAHIVIFDVYGEYHTAFSKINSINGINVRNYTTQTNLNFSDTEVVSIPPYFLEVDDLALLLNVNDHTLLPILEKTLQYVLLFKSSELSTKYKNSIIAKGLLDTISTGKSPNELADQIVSILNKFHTDELNLDSQIVQPGYVRTIKQCLNLDANGKMSALQFIIEFLNKFVIDSAAFEEVQKVPYTLDDIFESLEFALMSEGMLNNNSLYEKANDLRVRLHTIINSPSKKYFTYDGEFIEREQYVKGMFLTPNAEFVQLINMNFSFVDDRLAKIITKIFMKIFFNFETSLEKRGSFPIHVIIEEAHRYIQNDNDINVIGYNIFDRITKEGRKYGLLLGLITQRPSELSTTSLSQCSNFVVFRIFYPDDLKIVTSMSSNLTNQDIEKLKTLRPGNAMVFGSAFKVPLMAKLEFPEPAPASNNVNLEGYWYNS